MAININLAEGDLTLILEALDCYEYWELGQLLPRNNGSVWLPDDCLGGQDPYWAVEPVDGALLIDLWPGVILPRDIRAAWQPILDGSPTPPPTSRAARDA